ncbi:hypothetical protein C2G38_2026868 [Gigaspora rosea]|uniref:Peptidase S1 domain-containing protein n=1 Tax=Gigaspora rosea TaxID=44941 RepID=A0A397WC28_9GLOM|nr:hypothetical protein C2G38_2026868 [Gigaspora rosea]
MVITSHSSIISQRKNIDNTNVFLTSERIKETSRVKNKHKGNNENEKRNVSSRSIVVHPVMSKATPENNYPIGRFFKRLPDGSDGSCTASVINTRNGNIGITAAHCLLDSSNGDILDKSAFTFSPGYDNGTHKLDESVDVEDFEIPLTFLVASSINDYALVKFAFKDPFGKDETLQYYTGGLGWRFDIGNDTLTNFFGYSGNGDLENCIRDGRHLCEWQGYTQLESDDEGDYDYVIRGNLGYGASGGPLIYKYNRTINLGYVYSVYRAWRIASNESVAYAFDETVFTSLLSRLHVS